MSPNKDALIHVVTGLNSNTLGWLIIPAGPCGTRFSGSARFHFSSKETMNEFSFPFPPYGIQLQLMNEIKECIDKQQVRLSAVFGNKR